MVSKKFLKQQMMRLEQNYGVDRFKITLEMFNLWADIFKDYNEEGLRVSIDEYMRTSEYPPTVGSIAKIYKAKDEYRKNLLSYLKGKYIWICRWTEVEPTQEDFSMFCRYAVQFPASDRKQKVEEVVSKIVRYYNDTQKNKPLKEWLK